MMIVAGPHPSHTEWRKDIWEGLPKRVNFRQSDNNRGGGYLTDKYLATTPKSAILYKHEVVLREVMIIVTI